MGVPIVPKCFVQRRYRAGPLLIEGCRGDGTEPVRRRPRNGDLGEK